MMSPATYLHPADFPWWEVLVTVVVWTAIVSFFTAMMIFIIRLSRGGDKAND